MSKKKKKKIYKKILDSKKNVNFIYIIINLTPFQIKTFKELCNYIGTLTLGYSFKLNYGKPKNN